MKNLLKHVQAFIKDEEGLTTVEYAVAGGLIAAAVILSFQALGVTVGGVIDGINGALTNPGGGGTTA